MPWAQNRFPVTMSFKPSPFMSTRSMACAWLINCAALANLEECERHPDQARRLNAEIPGELAGACAERNIKFVHLSTDAVFDGTKEGDSELSASFGKVIHEILHRLKEALTK